MSGIGFGAQNQFHHIFYHLPDLSRVRLKGTDMRILFWIIFTPQTARTAEVGNAALHRDPRTGQGDGLLR